MGKWKKGGYLFLLTFFSLFWTFATFVSKISSFSIWWLRKCCEEKSLWLFFLFPFLRIFCLYYVWLLRKSGRKVEWAFFFLFLLFIVWVWERKHRVCTFNACLDSVTWICFVSFDLFYVINFGTAIVVLMHPHLIKWSLPLWTLHLLRC